MYTILTPYNGVYYCENRRRQPSSYTYPLQGFMPTISDCNTLHSSNDTCDIINIVDRNINYSNSKLSMIPIAIISFLDKRLMRLTWVHLVPFSTALYNLWSSKYSLSMLWKKNTWNNIARKT
jgi:hypothetical protein